MAKPTDSDNKEQNAERTSDIPKYNKSVSNPAIMGRGGKATIITQKLRLVSGLTLFAYVTMHYVNHALGNFSFDLMEAFLEWQTFIWQSFPGTILLYGAFITHISLVLWKLIRRRTFKMPVWEWVQILLGVLIPYFLLTHLIAMRYPAKEIGIYMSYHLAFGLMWPAAAIPQTILLLITWVHGCIGVHFWLRTKRWYERYQPWFLFLAVVTPSLALTGWINAARTNASQLELLAETDPEAAQEYKDTVQFLFETIIDKVVAGRETVPLIAAAIVGIIIVHQIYLRLKRGVKVDYGDGRQITAAPGTTILDISRQAGIPHMSVCGGRARCSTCRTLILEGHKNVQPKTASEAALLDRLKADDSIRLACQAKVSGNVTIRPLVQAQDQAVTSKSSDPLGWGVEKEIAILFLDIRGFSRISEKSLPYDIIFILNSFFGEVASAVEKNNGYVDKFMGDGMMALFGLEENPQQAARNAIKAAIDCELASRKVSRILTQHLSEPIKIGIGIHVGDAIIGRIGKTNDQNTPSRLTAIGDSVNISARLEQATKELKTPLVVSTKTAELAGLKQFGEFGNRTEINVHNISRPVDIVAVTDINQLQNALDDKPVAEEMASG